MTRGVRWKDNVSLCLGRTVYTLQYIWAHINIPKINRKDRGWLNFLGLFTVCWADMLGVIYLPTIKNIYESVSAVCSKQEVINLPVYPPSPPLLSLCWAVSTSLSLPPPLLPLIPHFSVALITEVSARAHKDLPSISNSSVLIGFSGRGRTGKVAPFWFGVAS